jgi:hypothetical protein
MPTPPDPAGTDRTRRLEQDRALLAKQYPELRFELDERRGAARASGPIVIDRPDGSQDAVQVRIEFGPGYPGSPPRSYDAARRWKPDSDRHIEPGGHFCLFLAGVDNPDLGDEGSLLDYMAELTSFVHQQLILDAQRKHNPSARFPGPEWAHGSAAYAAFAALVLAEQPEAAREPLWQAAVGRRIDRSGPCPCGSGHPHDDCHLPVSKRLRRALYEARQRGDDFDHLTYVELATHTPSHA